MKLRPDGILGAIVGSEAMGVTDTLVNGAGGCRSRAQIMLHELIPEYHGEDPRCCGSRYFSRQSRLPCTYLNGDDIVMGADAKVADGVREVSSITGRRTMLIDTLGASLVCTDLSGEAAEPLTLPGDLASASFAEGYDMAVRAVLEASGIQGEPEEGVVNVLGYGIHDLGWTYGRDEIRELFSMMGLEVAAFIGCMPSPEEMRASGRASLCVQVHPEYCERTSVFYSDRGIPPLRPSTGVPVGYAATRSFLREVAEAAGVDPSPALEAVDEDERRVRAVLMNSDRAVDGLRARGFTAEGDSSVVYPLSRWMRETFGMVPRRLEAFDDAYSREIASLPVCPEGDVEVSFTDGISALEGRLSGGIRVCVEVGMPRGRQLDLMGRCLVGRPGCRYVLDETLNGIRRFRCGQPTPVDMRDACMTRD